MRFTQEWIARLAGLGRAAGLISNQYRHDSELRHDRAQQLPEALVFLGRLLGSFQSFVLLRLRLDVISASAVFAMKNLVQSECKRTEPVLSGVECRDYTRDAADARHALRILHRHTKN